MRLKRWEPAASAFITSLLRDHEDILSLSGCFQSKMGYRLELEAEGLLPDATLAGWVGTKPEPFLGVSRLSPQTSAWPGAREVAGPGLLCVVGR